jgi:hypothetical protein
MSCQSCTLGSSAAGHGETTVSYAPRVTDRQRSNEEPPSGGRTLSERPGHLLPGGLSRIQERLNSVCPYFTMFPLGFPLEHLARAQPGESVIDPFCGRGTTLYAARALSLESVGIDANPVAAAIAAAKVADVSADKVEALAVQLLGSMDTPEQVPTGEFWQWAYYPDTLRDVCLLREQLLAHGNDPAAVVLRAIVLGLLHGPRLKGEATYLSNQMPRTYATKPAAAVRFWRARDLRPPHVRVLDAVRRRVRYTLADVPAASHGAVLCGDAATVLPQLSGTFDWVVTSPPYLGMRSYVPDQWIRNWFLGGPAEVDYSRTNQLHYAPLEAFIADLATVWARLADRCAPTAHMAIRFGALPSIDGGSSPQDILTRSLIQAAAGWVIDEITDAGQPSRSARQATQFRAAGSYTPEIDCLVSRG